MTFATIGKILERLEPSLRTAGVENPRKVLLDMTSNAFCSPTGITILAAAVEQLFAQGAPAATRALANAVQEHAKLDEESLGALKSCLNEVVENVFYHAESPIDALVCAQAYKKKKRTELVIADTGRGIRAALSEVPEYRERTTDDCEAIKLALEKNVTTTGDIKRGIGLWVASEVIRRNEGELLILSQDGGLRVDGDGAHDVTDHFWPGTLVVIEFRTDRPINTTAVYDSGEFPDDDDSFGF